MRVCDTVRIYVYTMRVCIHMCVCEQLGAAVEVRRGWPVRLG